MKIIVGSKALKYFGELSRDTDTDYWLSDDEIAPVGDRIDCKYMPMEILSEIPQVDGYASPAAVYTIKLSHLVYPIFFNKHKLDVLLLKHREYEIVQPLYNLLCDYWPKEHGEKKFLSLNKNKSEFFDDYVEKLYDHDYLHELVAYPDKPVYTLCLKEGCEVLIDKAKFDLLPFETQVKMFREEMAVIALERWLLNKRFKDEVTWFKAHILALEKTTTALTKGWASRFIVENIEMFTKPEYSYFKHALETLHL